LIEKEFVMSFWSRLTGKHRRVPQPGEAGQPRPVDAELFYGTQVAQGTLDEIRHAEKVVENTERAVRDLEQSYSEMAGLSKPDPVKLRNQETQHREELERLLHRQKWAKALQLLEQRTDDRRWVHAKPVKEDEDLKVVLRSKILDSLLEGGHLVEASAFLNARSEQATRRIDEIHTDVQTRNRLVKGQLDTMLNLRRGKS
jgi:hypothetical protein